MTTSDYGYWYAPGAIYQYDQGSSSLITSVAALLSPGFTRRPAAADGLQHLQRALRLSHDLL